MIDINLIRTNPDLVRENIKKKFQDAKLPLVDEVIELDKKNRALKQEGDDLRAMRNKLSGEVGKLMKEKKLEEAEKIKAQVKADADKLVELEAKQAEIDEEIKNGKIYAFIHNKELFIRRIHNLAGAFTTITHSTCFQNRPKVLQYDDVVIIGECVLALVDLD